MPANMLPPLTPAERRHKRIRDTILQAAEKTFAQEGEEGLSIRRLAEEVDYSPAALYKYFASKQDLVDALKESFFERLLDALDALPEQTDNYYAHIHEGLSIYIRTALEKPYHYRAAFSALPSAQVPLPALSDDSVKTRAFTHLLARVHQGVEQGVFRQDLCILDAAKFVWASCHGLVILMTHMPNFEEAYRDGKTLSRPKFIAQHIDFILKGLAP